MPICSPSPHISAVPSPKLDRNMACTEAPAGLQEVMI